MLRGSPSDCGWRSGQALSLGRLRPRRPLIARIASRRTPPRATLFPDETRLRAAVVALVGAAPGEQVVFNIVDSHIHSVIVGSRGRVGRIAQATALALRGLSAVPLAPAKIRPVTSRSHIQNLVAYVLRQDLRHGTVRHPALAAGSCFQDLVGARVLPKLNLRLHDALPRYGVGPAFKEVGLVSEPLEPVGDEAIRSLGTGRLVEAAAAACCVAPDLSGRTTLSVSAARRAAASLARKADLPATELARIFDLSERSIRHLASTSSTEGEQIETTIRKRLALEERAKSAPVVIREAPPEWDEYGEHNIDAVIEAVGPDTIA